MDKPFTLKYIGTEDHLMMPALTTMVMTQQLYEILFQYLLTPEQEKQLMDFIDLIQVYLDNKANQKAPFSVPREQLAFLDEGMEELRMLCWLTIPVFVFEIDFEDQASYDQIENILMDLFVFTRRGDKQILVYPPSIV